MKKMALLLAALLLLSNLAGCGKSSKGKASVESVSMICGLSGVGQADRFAGVVSAQGETKVEKDDSRQVASVAVKTGDEVKKGQTLFTYDQTQAQLDLEKAQLELEQMKSTLSAKQEEKARLERDKSNVSADQQLQYDLEIREATAAILEQQYNITLKEKEVQRLGNSVGSADVTSPVDGRVQAVNENGGTDSNGKALPFMTIVETAGFRVKGYVNENNASALSKGAEVLVRSRVGSDVWKGSISSIDWKNPATGSNQNTMDGGSDVSTASKYPFYVTLDSSDGLLMGQHVYIEPDHGQGQRQEGIHLPAYYINDADTSPWVWAQDKNGKLEKRSLTLGTYEEDLATYPVESGLAAEDYIAFPDETLAVGMTCVPYDQSTFEPDGSKTPDGSIDQPAMDGGLDLPEGGDGAVTDGTATDNTVTEG